MSRSYQSGAEGEDTTVWILERQGWKVLGRHVRVAGGHVLDLLLMHPVLDEEWLCEVKVWGVAPSGKDTVKKAIADAYDLREAGELRPLLLVISHRLDGLLGDMLVRARRAGAINEIRIISSTEHYG